MTDPDVDTQPFVVMLTYCTARFAHGVVDLDAACISRLAEKIPRCGANPIGMEETTMNASSRECDHTRRV